ncbi:hypothetical protein [Absidia glauca]|uniref:Uncharacterized protein n=1 Tax=Absidia glauca TaxID=4829 RepID=A0A168PQ75_ABSGL|nr:hypothetical protein [Absidia glauca]
MHRHTLAFFFFLALLSVTFAGTDFRPGMTYEDIDGYGGSEYSVYNHGGSEREDASLRGKSCKSVLDCGIGNL